MLVYSPDGVAEEKEPCDARECIANCGYTAQPKESAKVVEAPKVEVVEAPVVADEVTVAPVSQVAEEYVPRRGRPSKSNSNDLI